MAERVTCQLVTIIKQSVQIAAREHWLALYGCPHQSHCTVERAFPTSIEQHLSTHCQSQTRKIVERKRDDRGTRIPSGVFARQALREKPVNPCFVSYHCVHKALIRGDSSQLKAGICVLRRRGSEFESIAALLTAHMVDYDLGPDRDRIRRTKKSDLRG